MTPQTPMMRQYFEAKAQHPGALVAMRVGDFYEFYGQDAEEAARLLQITLTGREDGKNGRIAMAGVPFHAAEKYIARLVGLGQKVALCEQLEDPKTAKGLVKRGVNRVVSAGTLLEDSMLEPGRNNFLSAVFVHHGAAGIAFLDTSTGELAATQVEGPNWMEAVLQEISRLAPAELLVGPGAGPIAELVQGTTALEHKRKDTRPASQVLERQFNVSTLAGFGIDGEEACIEACVLALDYAATCGVSLAHVSAVAFYTTDSFMAMDTATRRSLELTRNMADGGKRNTLFEVLDHCVTPMGSRLLRRWIEQPLLECKPIERRHDAVERLVGHPIIRGDLRAVLKGVADIERLASRCAAGVAGPRDVASLGNSLSKLPEFDDAVRKVALGRLQEIREEAGDHEALAMLISSSLVVDPPANARDGGVFREGHDQELDKLRHLSRNGKKFIAGLEQSERASTGIDRLKIGYNSVFGYYLEIPKALADKAPGHYIRKQTTANAERYITAELKDHESAVLGAEEKSIHLEEDLFVRLRARIAGHTESLLKTAKALAEADTLCALAEAATKNGYCRPEIVPDDVLEIKAGRHPVVEGGGMFVSNDTAFDGSTRLVVLTGPNMSGKSTYLRQNALIALMAQTGSFVPADSCRMGLCDRIFTRVGARDELALGQSTFLVEMIESANILNGATERSLVVLDEVGRGTSTYDGLAIAWAMTEHLASVRAKALFATHYHQLNELASHVQGVANFRVAVHEEGDQIVWTHKILPGGADRSYGIQVARMAGVPPSVLVRAEEVLAELEERKSAPSVSPAARKVQLTLFEAEPPLIVQELERLEVEQMTPMEALVKLDDLKRRFGTGCP